MRPQYLLWGLRGPRGQEQFLGQRGGQGKPGGNLTNIRSIELPVPPLREQRCIIAYLDDLQAKVEQLKTLQAPTAAELDTLIPSIPDGAFPGGVYATPCPAPNVSAEARQVVFKRPGLDDLKVGWIDFAETRKIVARWPDL